MFLFGARDVWFVVALPVYFSVTLGWSHWLISGFLASWIITYGFVQSIAPRLTGKADGKTPDGQAAFLWALGLAVIPLLIAIGMSSSQYQTMTLVIGLMTFGGLFAINSSLHSYLIVSYAGRDGVSLDVGFYYMANAIGRLLGTVLSGWIYQTYGLGYCLVISSSFLLIASLISLLLPKHKHSPSPSSPS